MIQFVRLPSLKLSSILLILLLIYDVFWVGSSPPPPLSLTLKLFLKVFASSSIFNANVMVEVAIKKAKSPVAVVAESLNMPKVSQVQPFLSLPGKLVVPR